MSVNRKVVNPFQSMSVSFEKQDLNSLLKETLDDRFTKVKIWLAHTGENRNNSIFTKELLESMIPSLANIPILGYIAVNEDNEIDFKGHEEALVIKDNDFKIKYIGHAYGVIPENNNARFEMRYGEDGIEREYLVVEGLLWKKFSDVEDIFDRDGGYKSQSMELQLNSVAGYFNDEGLLVYTSAKFEGACILGEGVTPAMVSSTIEKFSANNTIQTELKEMLEQFNLCFSLIGQEEGDENVAKGVNPTVGDDNEVKNFTEGTEGEGASIPTGDEGEGKSNFAQ